MSTQIHDNDLAQLIQRSSLTVISGRIREARMDAGLTLDALAEKIGSSRQHLIELEKAKHRPRVKMLKAIAEATGRDAQWFVGLAGDAPFRVGGDPVD